MYFMQGSAHDAPFTLKIAEAQKNPKYMGPRAHRMFLSKRRRNLTNGAINCVSKVRRPIHLPLAFVQILR